MNVVMTPAVRIEACKLRFEDIGPFDHATYEGCFQSSTTFVCEKFIDIFDIPEYIFTYIDIEGVAEDKLRDYTVYDGSHGVHIFCNKPGA